MSGQNGSLPALITIRATQAPKTWAELEAQVAAWAIAHGEKPDIVLADLRRGGPLARMICRELGVARPRRKPGPKPEPGFDYVIGVAVAEVERQGLKGTAKWQKVHSYIDNKHGVGEFLSVTPGAIEQRHRRARRRGQT